jgi:hypothetical protein
MSDHGVAHLRILSLIKVKSEEPSEEDSGSQQRCNSVALSKRDVGIAEGCLDRPASALRVSFIFDCPVQQ